MTVRLVLCLVFMSAMLIARPVVAQSPYFDEYIDHAKFVRLPPQEQRDFLVALMQTVADLEQKAIQAGQQKAPNDEAKTVHQRRWEQVKKALENFTRQLGVENAYAQATPSYAQTCFSPGQSSAVPVKENGKNVSCLFGSYRSTYVRSGSTTYCQRPGCSINPEIRAEYARIANLGSCTKQQMACNPALFGYDNSGTRGQKPTCVQLDVGGVNSVHNASLSCLIAVTNDQNSTQRLDNIATAIKNNRSTAEEFNKLLHSITNLCICDGEVGTDADVPAYLQDMSNTYSQYISDHRTCNALLSQTSLVLQKIQAQGGGSCVTALLPQNVSRLSQDLSFINNFSSHFHKLARGANGTAEQRLTPAQINSALVQYRARWVVTADTQVNASASDVKRVAADEALDNVADYITRSNELKARSSTDVNRWCPLNFPDPEVPLQTLTCTISAATSTRAADGKVSVAATVTVNGLAEGVTASNIVWKANNAVVAEQTGLTLSAANIEGIAADAANVPVVATYTPQGGQPVTCEGTAAFAAAAEPVTCTLALTAVTKIEGQEKYTVTATIPETVTGTITSITWNPSEEQGTSETNARSRVVIVSKPESGTTLNVTAAVVTSTTPNCNCTGTAEIPAVVAATTEACTLVPSVVKTNDGKYSVSMTISNSGQEAPEGEPTYTGLPFSTANGVGMVVVAPEAAVLTKAITATYVDKAGKNRSCTVNAIIPAREAPAPSTGGAPYQQPQQQVIPKAGQSLFKPGLR